MSNEIDEPTLRNPLEDKLVSEEDLKESAMQLHELVNQEGFDKKELGDYVISEVYEFYSEQRADELNRTLLALIPGGTVRIGFVPVPMALIKVGLERVLDKVTPEIPLQLLVRLLRKAGLTSV
jgi:hypothetical protein